MKLIKTFIIKTKPIPLNNVYNNAAKGRVRTDRYNTWRRAMGWEIKAQHPTLTMIVTGKYAIKIKVGRKVSTADIDNLIKPLADILVHMEITPDDKHMELVSIEKSDDPFVTLSIFEIRET